MKAERAQVPMPRTRRKRLEQRLRAQGLTEKQITKALRPAKPKAVAA